jgi:Spy/CpxP family protein refolding chaperone
MHIRNTLLSAAAALALTASIAVAHEDHHGGPGMGEGMEILHSLNLTDAQKEQVHGIERTAWAQARPIMMQMHAVHEQLANAVLGTVLQIRALLTPEQVEQASTMHQKLAALHEQEHAIMEPTGDHTP